MSKEKRVIKEEGLKRKTGVGIPFYPEL